MLRALLGQRIVFALWWLLLSFFVQVHSAEAAPISAPPVVLSRGRELFRHPLAEHMEVLVDATKELKIGDVKRDPAASSFQPFPGEEIWKPSPPEAIWVRFEIKNDQDIDDFVAIGPFRNELHVEMFSGAASAPESPLKSVGPEMPYGQRELRWQDPWMLLPLRAGEGHAVYLRYEAPQGGFLLINPTINTSHSMIMEEAPNQMNWFFGNGVYAGIMLAMSLYNLFVYLSIRDKSYLFYVVSIATFGLVILAAENLGSRYFWSSIPGWSQGAQSFFGAISGMAGLMFVRTFLSTKINTPKLDRILIVGIFTYLAALAMQIAGATTLSGIVFGVGGGLMGVVVLVVGVICVRRKWRPARYFLIAWVLMIAGIWISEPYYLGLFTANGIIANAWKVGSAGEVTLLSFALADRFRLMREEIEQAQRALMESQARELEASQEAGRNLEALVRQRLSELELRNRELARSREELSRARDEAMTASRAKSIFLANMSHELRTPLNAIIGYSELLIEDAEGTSAAVLSDLQKIQEAGRHLLALIDNILDISKIEAGRMDVSYTDTDIKALLTEIGNTVHPLMEKRNNRFELIIDRDVKRAFTDASRLRQVLLNLLGNAAKFTENGLVRLSASREAKDEQDWLLIAVGDNGIGIKPEQMSQLFLEYAQASRSTSKTFGGTGLGLAISRRICRLFGGDLTAESEGIPGKGSVFTVRVPVRPKGLGPAPRGDSEGAHPSQRA